MHQFRYRGGFCFIWRRLLWFVQLSIGARALQYEMARTMAILIESVVGTRGMSIATSDFVYEIN